MTGMTLEACWCLSTSHPSAQHVRPISMKCSILVYTCLAGFGYIVHMLGGIVDLTLDVPCDHEPISCPLASGGELQPVPARPYGTGPSWPALDTAATMSWLRACVGLSHKQASRERAAACTTWPALLWHRCTQHLQAPEIWVVRFRLLLPSVFHTGRLLLRLHC